MALSFRTVQRELRLWGRDPEHGLQPPGEEPAQPCDEDDTEEGQAEPSLEDEEMSTDAPMPPRALQQSSVFREGAVFRGTQRVSRAIGGTSPEDWGVIVKINEIDFRHGRCSGDMMAVNVPLATSPVVTHWEGEIVDGLNHSFVTCKWGATYGIDLAHWRKFGAFAPLNRKWSRVHGRCGNLHEFPYIFMRWKEGFFVDVRDEGCSLTIAGFYYVCLCRLTGRVEGFYYDPNSTPYQKLELELDNPYPTFSSYEFA